MRSMPTWTWQSRRWPDFSFDVAALAPALAAARRAQGEVIGLARALGMDEARNAEAAIWASESVATAAIEGEKLDLASVRSSIARRMGLTDNPPSGQRAVEGLLDMMQDAASHWQQPLTLKRLCAWQAALFPTGYSGLQRIATGRLRRGTEPMQIVSGPIDKPKVHYVAPPAARLPAEVRTFLTWFNGESRTMDGLARAGIAHLWFEVIHPFEDGNGRVGRAIVDLALAQHLEGHPRIVGLATELSANRAGYYAQLREASLEGADITAWLTWFCDSLCKACGRSAAVMDASLFKARFWAANSGKPLSAAQRKVVNRLLEAGPRGFEGDLTTRKYCALTGLSRATAYRDLVALERQGVLAAFGQGKATRYHLALEGWGPVRE
jgi:Fic family protein